MGPTFKSDTTWWWCTGFKMVQEH